METRKDRMNNPYTPKLHDYVRYHSAHRVHEGWVYYADHETISIELGVTEKPHCPCTITELHKKNHILLVVPHWKWDRLEYITCREGFHDESIRDPTGNNR